MSGVFCLFYAPYLSSSLGREFLKEEWFVVEAEGG